MFLIDTDVMVDVIRRNPAASEWMNTERIEQCLLPGLTALELLRGCATKLDARRLERFTNRFRIVWPTVKDSERARHAYADANLAHGIGIIDMLIAETAVGLGVPLMTFNDKHFRVIPNLVAIKPYER